MRKRLTALLCVCLLVLSLLPLYGCGEMYFEYESTLKLNSQFKGTRTLTIDFGSEMLNNSELKEKLTQVINDCCPSSLQREEVVEDNSLKYIFSLNFDSRADYISKISKIIGRQVQAWLVQPNSALAKGWRFKEDFKTDELFNFIKSGVEEKKINGLSFTISCISNIVNLDGDIQSCTGESTDIDSVKGQPVTGIFIETTNNKMDSYDRKLTLSVPQQTYDKMGNSLIDLMRERTLANAAYSGWSQQGNNQEYQIVYNGLSLSELQNATAVFLDCDAVSLYYGDQNNSSTPLAEQLVFEENINLLSFVKRSDSEINFSYKYSLPLKTTHGEGVLLQNGVWAKQGEWIDGIYSLKSTDSIFDIRIPDGIQYEIKGINVTLESYDNDSFVRSLDLVYSFANGDEGRDYAYDFFTKKGVDVTRIKSDDGVICRVTSKGSAKQISQEINSLFGSGNSLAYSQNTDDMSVVTDVSFTDEINISYMLTGANKEAPVIYTLFTKGNESVSAFSGTSPDGSGDISELDIDKSNGYVLKLQGGEITVKYTATLPYMHGVLIYCLVSFLMIVLTVALILLFMKRSRTLAAKQAAELAQRESAYESEEAEKALPEEHAGDMYGDDDV